MNETIAVMKKELREIVRDRRSLGSGLMYGVWGPLVMALALVALARDRASDATLKLPVLGAERASSLVAFLANRDVIAEPATPDIVDAVRARRAPIALVITRDFAEDFRGAKRARVRLLFESSWTESRTKADRLRRLLDEYARSVGDTRLIFRGIEPASIATLTVDERDYATAASRAATVLALLPIFVLLATFIGGMGIAADLMAGERERGSLESLLLNPAPRRSIVIGKWLATSLAAFATVLVTIVMAHLILRHPRVQAIDLPVGLSAEDAWRMTVVLLPLALFASALQLLVALFARTYKEAQTQLSLLMFAPMLPGFLFAFGSLKPEGWMAWVPMLGQHVAMATIVRGESVGSTELGILSLSALAGTALILMVATQLMSREWIGRRLG
jgi:sodium transport system permease protein